MNAVANQSQNTRELLASRSQVLVKLALSSAVRQASWGETIRTYIEPSDDYYKHYLYI